jgi:tetrahydromethanopterin S-methyltransferase subunit F
MFERAMIWYALAAIPSVLILFCSNSATIERISYRFAWSLTPFRALPCIFDSPEFMSNDTGIGSGVGSIGVIEMACLWLLAILLFGIFTMGLHILAFHLAARLHKWFGRPRYWATAAARLDKRALLVRSAVRTFWLMPLGIAVGTIFDKAASDLQYIDYPLISREWWAPASTIAALVLAGLFICSRVIRRAVSHEIAIEELICTKCGYLLRGVESDRCPECATAITRQRPVAYGLLLPGSPASRRISAIAVFFLVAGLLSIPVWFPTAQANLWGLSASTFPVATRRYWPISPRLNWFMSYKVNQFPIRPDASHVVIRHAGSAGRIRFFKKGPVGGHYETAYWSNAERMEHDPPDIKATGLADSTGVAKIELGPWTIKYWHPGNYLIWLNLPDSTYQLTAFIPSQEQTISTPTIFDN